MSANPFRALCAEPEPEGPSEDDLTQLLFDSFRGPIEFICDAKEEARLMIGSHVKFARAVLARWGRPTPQPPADGEVADLVAALKVIDKMQNEWILLGNDDGTASPSLTMPISLRRFTVIRDALSRAAELLQHLSPPQPEPVSKRLPGAKDCDNRGRCWTTDHDPSLVYSPVWKMTELPRQDLGHDFSNAYFWRNVRFWLPANAIPQPTSEEASNSGG